MESNTNPYLKAQQTKDIQSYLNKHGYTDDTGNTLAVDGSYGPKTQQALQKFNVHQSHMNTPDPETRDMQSLLKGFGYKNADGTPLVVDGIHGPNTDAAINAFENDFLSQVVPNYTPKTVQTTVFPKVPNLSKVDTAIPTVNKQSIAPNGLDDIYSTGGGDTSVNTSTPYKTDTVQNTDTTWKTSQSLPDMTSGMNKMTDKAITGNAKQPGVSYGDTNKRMIKPFDDVAYNVPDSGGSTAMINKVFNDYNRNAGLDKSGVVELAGSSNPTNADDTAHDKSKNLAIDMYGFGESLPHNAGAGLARDMFGAGIGGSTGGGLTAYDQNQYQLYKTLGGQESKYQWEYDYGKDIQDKAKQLLKLYNAGKSPNSTQLDFIKKVALFDADILSDGHTTNQSNPTKGEELVNNALKYLGHPYPKDLENPQPGDIDCSTLTRLSYKDAGINLPWTAADQAEYCYRHNLLVKKEDLKPGDLIFWMDPYKTRVNGRFMTVYHVAVYADNGYMVESTPKGNGVAYHKTTFQSDTPVLYGRPYLQ